MARATSTCPAITFGSNNFSLDAWVRHGAGTLGTEVLVDKRTSVGPTTRGYSLFLSSGQIGLQLADGTLAIYCTQETFTCGAALDMESCNGSH